MQRRPVWVNRVTLTARSELPLLLRVSDAGRSRRCGLHRGRRPKALTKADFEHRSKMTCLNSGASFEQRVGAQDHSGRYFEPERLGRFEVDDHL
jgi:hypothetical protein